VDPVFEFPTNTQSLNPYSYVLNNPLSLTDPTGYTASGCPPGNTTCPSSPQSSGLTPGQTASITVKTTTTPIGSHIAQTKTTTLTGVVQKDGSVAVYSSSTTQNGGSNSQSATSMQNKPTSESSINSPAQTSKNTLAQQANNFQNNIVHPALTALGSKYDSKAAESLLTETAIAESDLKNRTQFNGGPAVGLFQMEPRTARDLWNNYLPNHPDLFASVKGLMSSPKANYIDEIRTNDKFAAAMARIKYLTIPRPLPGSNNLPHQSIYWRRYYNGISAHGMTAKEFEEKVQYWQTH